VAAVHELDSTGEAYIGDGELATEVDRLLAEAVRQLEAAGRAEQEWNREAVKAARKSFDRAYQPVKNRLLRAAAEGRVPVRRMVVTLDRLSAVRRAVDQALKAARYQRKLRRACERLQDDDREAHPADTAASVDDTG